VWNAWDMVVKPAFLMILSIGIYFAVFSSADPFQGMPLFIKTALHIAVLSGIYLVLLAFSHIFKREKPEQN